MFEPTVTYYAGYVESCYAEATRRRQFGRVRVVTHPSGLRGAGALLVLCHCYNRLADLAEWRDFCALYRILHEVVK